MKKWRIPVVTEVTINLLSEYIQIAARSGICWGAVFR